jgi:hypothetical protein
MDRVVGCIGFVVLQDVLLHVALGTVYCELIVLRRSLSKEVQSPASHLISSRCILVSCPNLVRTSYFNFCRTRSRIEPMNDLSSAEPRDFSLSWNVRSLLKLVRSICIVMGDVISHRYAMSGLRSIHN